MLPILPSLVILAESAISEVLQHGFNDQNEFEDMNEVTSDNLHAPMNWESSE
jgi:hypothetical protein